MSSIFQLIGRSSGLVKSLQQYLKSIMDRYGFGWNHPCLYLRKMMASGREFLPAGMVTGEVLVPSGTL